MSVRTLKTTLLASAMSLGALLLASCSETIDTAQERRSASEKAFLAYKDSTGYERVSLPGAFEDRYVYMKWLQKAEDRSKKPKATDYIRMYYRAGYLLDGIVFDSNENIADASLITPMAVKRASGGLIDGMAIALQNMAVGDEAVVVVPWYLAYGEAGVTSGYQTVVPSYMALSFSVKLKEIVGDSNE